MTIRRRLSMLAILSAAPLLAGCLLQIGVEQTAPAVEAPIPTQTPAPSTPAAAGWDILADDSLIPDAQWVHLDGYVVSNNQVGVGVVLTLDYPHGWRQLEEYTDAASLIIQSAEPGIGGEIPVETTAKFTALILAQEPQIDTTFMGPDALAPDTFHRVNLSGFVTSLHFYPDDDEAAMRSLTTQIPLERGMWLSLSGLVLTPAGGDVPGIQRHTALLVRILESITIREVYTFDPQPEERLTPIAPPLED